MKLISKLLLFMLGLITPVFIAACYGAGYMYSKTGRVIDSETSQGIDNIQVTCIRNGANYYSDQYYSYADGTFYVEYNTACDQLRFEDIDGEANGGFYEPRTIPFNEDCEELTVELHR